MAGRKVTEEGDSGSSILDKDYNVAALTWGGDHYSSVRDLTFATPFSAVVQDIETRMRWEGGSCILSDGQLKGHMDNRGRMVLID
jgi:hypothetical protein